MFPVRAGKDSPAPAAMAGPIPTADMLRDLCELSALAQHDREELGQGHVEPVAGWRLVSDVQGEPAKGIKVEKLYGWRERKPAVLRCTTTMPSSVPPALVPQLMSNLALRVIWDKNIARTDQVVDIGPEGEGGADSRSINYSATKSALGGLVSPRDFVSYGTIPHPHPSLSQ